MTDAWLRLNPRQQRYLQAIFETDQAQERNERGRAAMDKRSRAVSEWRWIEYADYLHGHTPLKQRLLDAHLVDPGTGSTFKALADRGYILMKYAQATAHPLSDVLVYVRLTTKGRKLVRDALALSAPKKFVVGTLREWHWRALAKAYAANHEGVPSDSIGYGRIGWNTWLRLRDYTIKGTEYSLIEQRNGVSITDWGIGYYERSFVRYSDLYPDVSVPAPRAHHDPLEPFIEIVHDHHTCQACPGEYLIAVTRVYQQDQKWIWSIEESKQRIPGQVTRKYRETEQCTCQEEEIQEVSAPFLLLLDQLLERDWHVGFTQWFRSLDNAVGGVTSGREQRWYDPALVSQKLQPLLHDTDLPDTRHIAKGDVRYYWNPRLGKGKIYPREPNGELSLRPVAITRKIDI